MLLWALICLAWLVMATTVWYFWVAYSNRKKALDALQWINLALKAEGHVTGIRRISVSRFVVPLRMRSPIFRGASVLVEFVRRETLVAWLRDRRDGKLDSLTFQADLDCAPNFNFQVQNRRWFAGSRRHLPTDSSRWQLEPTEPVVFATRKWQREISVLVSALLSARQQELLRLSFRRKSPHFCATVPLDSVAPGANYDPSVFTLLREIAAEASAL